MSMNRLLKNSVFWDVAPCRCCGNRVPPKRRFTKDLHGTTSQKTAFFIVTAVKTSNLTNRFPPEITTAVPQFLRLCINKTNSGALVRQRTIPTERLPLVGEVSANFSG
jgi:hypothetical protein